MRPCEQTITTKNNITYTSGDINFLASEARILCGEILKINDLDDIKKLAEAIIDNWKRYVGSA